MLKAIIFHLEEVVGCLFMILFISLTFLNVVLRYCFGFIIPWAEEVILIAFVWSVFLGAVTAYRYDRHIAIDVVFNLFPKKMQTVLYYFIDLLISFLCLYITYLSIVLCSNVGAKSTFVLRLPYFYIYLMLVVSFGLMTIVGGYRFYLRWTGQIVDLDNVAKLQQTIESDC